MYHYLVIQTQTHEREFEVYKLITPISSHQRTHLMMLRLQPVTLPPYQFKKYYFHFIKVYYTLYFSRTCMLIIPRCPNERSSANKLICQIVVWDKSNQSFTTLVKTITFSVFIRSHITFVLNQIFVSSTISFKKIVQIKLIWLLRLRIWLT